MPVNLLFMLDFDIKIYCKSFTPNKTFKDIGIEFVHVSILNKHNTHTERESEKQKKEQSESEKISKTPEFKYEMNSLWERFDEKYVKQAHLKCAKIFCGICIKFKACNFTKYVEMMFRRWHLISKMPKKKATTTTARLLTGIQMSSFGFFPLH